MKKHYLIYLSIVLSLGFTLWGMACINAQESKAEEKMKFLVIAETKDIFYTLSSDEREKLSNATSDYVSKAMQGGNILELYSIPGWNRSVSIEQYDSVDDLYNHFANDPSYSYINFEIYPLQKGDMQTDGAKEAKPDAKLKFLVIAEDKDVWHAIPADERSKIEEANSNYMSQLVTAGDFLEIYDIPGWNRAVAIEQYRSIEELYKHFDGFPGYPYGHYEVYPLYEVDLMN